MIMANPGVGLGVGAGVGIGVGLGVGIYRNRIRSRAGARFQVMYPKSWESRPPKLPSQLIRPYYFKGLLINHWFPLRRLNWGLISWGVALGGALRLP